MSAQKNQKTNTPEQPKKRGPKGPRVKLEDKLAQLEAMAGQDEMVAALMPAIKAAQEGVEDAKPALKRAKRRLRKLVAAAFSSVEE